MRLRAWLRIFGFLLALAFYLGRLIILSTILGFDQERGFRFRRKFTGAALKVLGVKLTVEGSPPDETVLYVSNHRSLLDPLIQLNKMNAFIVAKSEVGGYPLIGRGARETGVIFVERKKKESRQVAKNTIRQALVDGKSVMIYPEGTTFNFETTSEFKIGSFVIAAEEGIPVVPVAIEYLNPDHYWFNMEMLKFFLRKFSSRKIRTRLWIGEPIRSNSAEYLLRETQGQINAKILEMRKTLKAHAGHISQSQSQ